MPADETVHGIYLYHGPDQPCRYGRCHVGSHYGNKNRAMIVGTVGGEPACGACVDEVVRRHITWDGRFG